MKSLWAFVNEEKAKSPEEKPVEKIAEKKVWKRGEKTKLARTLFRQACTRMGRPEIVSLIEHECELPRQLAHQAVTRFTKELEKGA